MSTTAQTARPKIQKQTVKPKIHKQTTEKVDYSDKQRDKDLDRLWWAMLAGFGLFAAFMIGGFTLLYNIASDTKKELKAEIRDTKKELKAEIRDTKKELKAEIGENRKLLLQLIQKRQ